MKKILISLALLASTSSLAGNYYVEDTSGSLKKHKVHKVEINSDHIAVKAKTGRTCIIRMSLIKDLGLDAVSVANALKNQGASLFCGDMHNSTIETKENFKLKF